MRYVVLPEVAVNEIINCDKCFWEGWDGEHSDQVGAVVESDEHRRVPPNEEQNAGRGAMGDFRQTLTQETLGRETVLKRPNGVRIDREEQQW